MKILVVDDEALARKRMLRLLEELGDCSVVGEAANGKDALVQSSALNPDIVLLDIRMPEMDGMETAQRLSQLPNPPAIIFTTAFGDHALAAFDAHAVGYLLKPVRKDRLAKAIDSARRLNRAQLSLLQAPTQIQTRSHLSISNRGNIQLLALEDILYFVADQKYTRVVHQQGEALIEESLKSLEDEFGDRFARIHRNALVAVAHLTGITKDGDGRHYACLAGSAEHQAQLEISRRHLPAIRKLLKEFSS
jgi:two-component system response regulator AlgR